MFLTEALTMSVEALKQVFVSDYVSLDNQTDFANLHISLDYPLDKNNYPGVWVGFDVDGDLTRSGVDEIADFLPNADTTYSPLYLWRGQGWISYTCVALTSLQRARLFDEVTRVIAFNQDPVVNPFRAFIENNPLLAMNCNFDNIAVRSQAETPGTPWGSDEIVYEITLAVQAAIEFIATDLNSIILPINEIEVIATDPNGNNRYYTNDNGVQSGLAPS